MRNKKAFVLSALVLFTLSVFSQTINYKYRLYLKDKGDVRYSLQQPSDYLSQRAIDRRIRQNIPIDSTDFPLPQNYLTQIESCGGTIVAKSKWLNTVTVDFSDKTVLTQLKALPFVKSSKLVWQGQNNAATLRAINSDYSFSEGQISMFNGIALHNEGYRGSGMQIAVIDAGYSNLNSVSMLDNIHILEVKDFVYQQGEILSVHAHGLKVLSVMACNKSGSYIGAAPEASYRLYRTEDVNSEFPIEEDYWVTAAEHADSVGSDLINSSLIYSQFDSPIQNYTYLDLDGKTAFITRGAEIAAKKGIFVTVSAGNDRLGQWKNIGFPSDAPSVFTVGSVAQDSTISYFSSYGPTSDGRIKPDVVVQGSAVKVIDQGNVIATDQGTSFAAPLICGIAACLWQAVPSLTNIQLMEVIRKSSDRSHLPNNDYGYGIPNMEKALQLARQLEGSGVISESIAQKQLKVYVKDRELFIQRLEERDEEVRVIVYNLLGEKIYERNFINQTSIKLNETSLMNILILSVIGDRFSETIKVNF